MAVRKTSLTVYDNMEFSDYEFREFPKMVYSGEGKSLQTKVVDAVELEALDKAVWRTHPDPTKGLLAPKVEPKVEPKAEPEAAPKK